MGKQRSNWWYLLPLLFSWIGGLVGYFILKKDDPTKAKNVVVLGFLILGVGIILHVFNVATNIAMVSPALSLVK